MELGDIISSLLTIVTIIATIYISQKVAWESFYNTLMAEYRSLEFGNAMQNIILFFKNTCNGDISRIKREYEAIYINQVLNKKESDYNNVLHYQRRFLAQFFYDLNKCAKTPFFYIGRRRVQRDFTKGTKDLIRIIYFMDKAIDESEIMFLDISCDERVPNSHSLKGLNRFLSELYEVLKSSKTYME